MAQVRTGELDVASSQVETDAHIDSLIRQLGDAEYGNRKRAQDELKLICKPALEKLLSAMDSEDPEVVFRVREVLDSYANLLSLLDALTCDGHTTYFYDKLTPTQDEIVKAGSSAVPFLRWRLQKESNPMWRFNCVSVIDAIGTEEAVQLIISALCDSHPWVRGEAVWALGKRREKRYMDLVRGLLKEDKDEIVLREALLAVGSISGITVFKRNDKQGWSPSGSQCLTDEVQSLMRKTVDYYLEHDSLPEMPNLDFKEISGIAVSNSVPSSAGQVDWKVKMFRSPDGKGAWLLIR
jgi:hypothetical protein